MIADFAKKFGVKFKNPDLLQQAVTHRSYLNEHRNYRLDNNERLEFLGDAVLELVITEYLYKNYPNPEGDLTSWRSALVNGETLAKIARKLGTDKYLQMSKGEAKDKGRARQYLLANALEAIIGAIYLDRGYKEAQNFILKNIVVDLENVLKEGLYMDSKSLFQEKAQDIEKVTPSYKVIKEWGPDHDKHFIVGVYLGDKLVSKGKGNSKQEAQREAAKKGLENKNWK